MAEIQAITTMKATVMEMTKVVEKGIKSNKK
jgi:hypothetical protein